MRDFLRPLAMLFLVLLVPAIPFAVLLLVIPSWEEHVRDWSQTFRSTPWSAAIIVGLLTVDILLPVPSSVLCTAAGWQFGIWLGTLLSWLGMSLGAVLAFALARTVGQPLVARLVQPHDLERTGALMASFGPGLLILLRGVPIAAEASVLFVGLHQMPWRSFLLPVLVSNLALALAYAAFGKITAEHQLLPLALGGSIAAPLLMLAAYRLWTQQRK